MDITITKLYALLSDKLGKETAEDLTTYIETKINKNVETVAKDLAKTAEVKAMISEARFDMIKWFVGLFIALALMIIGLYFRT